MSMKRYWAIYDVYLGNPIFVERCFTKDDAMEFVEKRGHSSCGALYVVEQLLPPLGCHRTMAQAQVMQAIQQLRADRRLLGGAIAAVLDGDAGGSS